MTLPEQPLLRRLSRKRQPLRRHLYGGMSKRIILVVLAIAISALAVTTGPVLSQSGESPTPVTAANDSTAAPGAQVASAVSAEGTALNGDMQRWVLDVELTRTTSDRERAAIVATTISSLNGRLDTLEARAQRLQNARQTGRMRAAAFQAEYAPIAAEAKTIDQTLGRLQTTATVLTAPQFEAQYTNTTSIERLDERASTLTTDETIASSSFETSATPTSTPTATATTVESTTPDGSTATDQPTESTDTNENDSGDANNNEGDDADRDDDSNATEGDDEIADGGDNENEGENEAEDD